MNLPAVKTSLMTLFKRDKVSQARATTLRLLKDGRITVQEADVMLDALLTININNVTIDNRIHDNTSWGTIMGAHSNLQNNGDAGCHHS